MGNKESTIRKNGNEDSVRNSWNIITIRKTIKRGYKKDDCIRNIRDKAREERQRYFGHVKKREDGQPIKTAMIMQIRETRSV